MMDTLKDSLSFVSEEDPVLKEMLPIYHGDPAKLRELAFAMFKLMADHNGVGLSANQVGRKERFFVMYGMESKGFRDAIVAINPVVVSEDPEKKTAIEGCLSFPTKYCTVERPNSIRVEWTDLKGNRQQAILTDMYARIFLHELDHLRGLTMFDAGKELRLEDLMSTNENDNT